MIELLPGQVIAPPSVAPWWMGAGVTPIVVYQPWQTQTRFAAFVNRVDHTTHLIIAGVDPDWAAMRGWIFDGSSQYLETGIIPGRDWSLLILFRNSQGAGGTLGGMVEVAGIREMRLIVDITNDQVLYGNGSFEIVPGVLIDGCMVVAGRQGYRNGVADGDTLTLMDGHAERDLWIGARANPDASGPTSRYKGEILAFAVWDVPLNATQVTHVYNAVMEATYFNHLTVESSRTLWSGTAPAHDHIGRPVLINNGGVWVASYRSAASHTGDATDEIHLRFSNNEGVSWSGEDELLDGTPVTGAPFMRHSTNTAAGMDLMIAPNGDLLLHVGEVDSVFNPAGIYQWRSTDDGATWADEGLIDGDTELYNGQDYTYVDTDLYLATWRHDVSFPVDIVPNQSQLYKTSDSGVTWELVGDITEYADGTNECSIEYLGNGNMLSILRDDPTDTTWMRRSTDYGVTWGDLEDVGVIFGILGRPRLKHIGARLYLFGRHALGTGVERTVLWYSDEDGADGSWRGPYYAGAPFIDCGYCDILERANGDIYVMTYEGVTSNADVVEYVMRVNR